MSKSSVPLISIIFGSVKVQMVQNMKSLNFTAVSELERLKKKDGHLHQVSILSSLTMT